MDRPDTTTLALDRTVLANERTYQAWLRTGMAAMASGLGIVKFLHTDLPLWVLLSVGTLMMVLSAGIFLLAAWRYNHFHVRVRHLDIDTVAAWKLTLTSFLLAGCAILALGGMLLMRFWGN